LNIGDRKQLILQAIIEDYISTAEPVGSRTISKKYLTEISPATIRNEMADLEEMGYIEQPHTSSGRIPSDKGYRIYVNEILKQQKIIEMHQEFIKTEFFDTLGEIDRLIKHASKLLSQLTNYTSIAMAPQMKSAVLKRIQLIKIDTTTLLIVLITNSGIAKNGVIRVVKDLSHDLVDKLTRIFNEVFEGLAVQDIDDNVIKELMLRMSGYNDIVEQVLSEIIRTLQYNDKTEIYHDGAANMLNLPEFKDIGRAREFFNILEEKEMLFNLLNEAENDVSVAIGSENKYVQLNDCSVITATYKINGKIIGSIGVVGPTRMDYTKVISIVDCVKGNMTEILTKLLDR